MFLRILALPFFAVAVVAASYTGWQHPGTVSNVRANEGVVPPASIAPAPSGAAYFTYTNRPFGFSLTYPRTFIRDTSAGLGWSYGAERGSGATVLTLYLPPQTALVRAGGEGVLRVGVANDAASMETCLSPERPGTYQGTVTLGSETFTRYDYPETGIESYRTFHAGACYAVEIGVRLEEGAGTGPTAEEARTMLRDAASTFSFS
ncbi:MAG: hypothetical protein WDN10_05220 [bacterium]